MEKLPTEIILDILSRLPYETIINRKLVSKPWRDITSNIKVGFIFQIITPAGLKLCYGGEQHDDITATQGHHSYKTLMEIDNHPELETLLFDMVGSCNGLVCFSVSHDPIYICNPITGEYVYLPTFNYKEACNGNRDGYFRGGFGYDHSTDEYKVVRIYYDHFFKYNNKYSTITSCGQVQVYTLGSGHGWKDVGRVNHVFDSYRGVCANGALHWIEDRERKIVAFDLSNEEFRLIQFPPLCPNRSYNVVYLKLLFGGYLCVVHIDVGEEDRFIHVCALEKKKNVSSSYDIRVHDFNDFWVWSKNFCIPCARDARYYPFAFTKSNQVLMSSEGTIFCYDSGTNVLRKLRDDCPRSNLAIAHVNSLVSLEALGEKSKKTRK